ncbi:MAG: hypothetical protein Ct9H300mP14_03850 [Gammaproteobacteria bacterium]|nr:MAG: hypothetical protein Ct9H300mP14_03850 [Gammaproteobacteria bacterium]
MRMNPDMGQSAAEWLNTVTEERLRNFLRELGEGALFKKNRPSRCCCADQSTLSRTLELADIVAHVVPTREPGSTQQPGLFRRSGCRSIRNSVS